jgi:hypothetical protein
MLCLQKQPRVPEKWSKLVFVLPVPPVCPWCFIGKRRLEKAIRAVKSTDPDVNFEVGVRVDVWGGWDGASRDSLPVQGVPTQPVVGQLFPQRMSDLDPSCPAVCGR